MSTPTFNPTAEEFDDVRLYTELDPYYYTIDNRPLQDIVENVNSLGSSSDAARRAVLLEALSTSSVLSGLLGSTKKVLGLRASATTANTVTVDPGSMLLPGSISAGDSRQVLRVGASPLPTVLSCPPPVTLGREFTYVVQVKFNDFTGVQTYPNYDGANAFLPATLLDGFLTISVVVGAEANTGASIAPTVTPGYDALYTVVSVAGAPFPVVTKNASSPDRSNTISVEEPWTPVTFTGGWANVGGAFQTTQYRRIGNRVLIRGAMSGGTGAAFTLPVGYRPTASNSFLISNGAAVGVAVTITDTGSVTTSATSAAYFGTLEFFTD